MAFLSWGVLGTKGYKRVGSHRISSFSSSSSPSFPSSFFLFLPSYSFTSSTSSSFLTTNITHPLSNSVQDRRGGKDLWRSCCRMRRKMRMERREKRRQKTKKRAVVNLPFGFTPPILLFLFPPPPHPPLPPTAPFTPLPLLPTPAPLFHRG